MKLIHGVISPFFHTCSRRRFCDGFVDKIYVGNVEGCKKLIALFYDTVLLEVACKDILASCF